MVFLVVEATARIARATPRDAINFRRSLQRLIPGKNPKHLGRDAITREGKQSMVMTQDMAVKLGQDCPNPFTCAYIFLHCCVRGSVSINR